MKKGYNSPLLKSLQFFVENPYEQIHLREFARRLEISINSAQRFLNLFIEEKLIKEERKANLRYFKANMDSIVFRNIKITFSLKKIEDSGLINSLKEVVSHVVLFGSLAKGTDNKDSDIDLLIIGNKEKVRGIVFEFEKRLHKEINFSVFSWTEWKKQAEINKAFYQDVIIEGICLIGEKPIIE